MKGKKVLFLLIAFSSLTIFPTLQLKSQASGITGTGIGIRKEGPTTAMVKETIEYTITVYNLGDFWIRNVTVTDIFSNGTSSSWLVSDLAPLNQTGNSLIISGITYTIEEKDVLDNPVPHIQNYAEVRGYLDWYNSSKLVNAATDYPTLVTEPLIVGGNSIDTESTNLSTSKAIYIIVFSVIIAVFTRLKMKKECLS